MPALEFSVENNIATLLLNRPEAKNAINAEISDGLEAALLAIGADREIRVVIITGAGGAFCAGGDVRAMHAAASWNVARSMQPPSPHLRAHLV